jgi:hypothetical protein
VKPLVTFDLDGVIVGGEYIPIEHRDQAELYAMLPPLTPRAIRVLTRLIEEDKCSVGIITARGFDEAADVSAMWLLDQGVPVDKLAFIRTHTDGTGGKPRVLDEIEPYVHFDDRHEVAENSKHTDKTLPHLTYCPDAMWDYIEWTLNSVGLLGPIQLRLKYEESDCRDRD